VATTSAADCGVYDNTASFTSTNDGSGDATATESCNAASVQITKTADAATVGAGSKIGFTLTVVNTGSGTAHGVTATDTLPTNAGTSWTVDGGTAAATCSISGGKLTCNIGDLAGGASATVHISSPTTTATCGTVKNTGTVTTGNDGSDSSSASVSVTCPSAPPPPPPPSIDLAVTKVGTPNPQTINKDITWTMVVTNNGPDGATGVTVADPLPAGTTFVSVTTTQGTCTGGTMIQCSLGNMAAGATVTITLVTTAVQTGTLTNTVTVVGNEHETNTANNTATASVLVNGAFVPPKVVCSAVLASPKLLYVGRKTTLTLHVTKAGKPAKGVRVRITGPGLNVRTAPSNAKGIIRYTVKPKKAGIMRFTIARPNKTCKAIRIGITGVFTPPVTG
jgi:uncharacterized repeat protein (TIGR01451 family)